MNQIRKRLTYANVMSSLAVFLILGGATAFAVTKVPKKSVGTKQLKANAVTTAKVKKGAITTQKLKDNSVTGAKVNEATLGEVPSAASAKNAASASTVNGILATKVNYGADPVSGPEVIFSAEGLTLTAQCKVGETIAVEATTSVLNSSIYTSAVDTDANDNNSNDDRESGEFDPGVQFDLLAGEDGNPALVTFAYNNNSGSTVNGTIATDEISEGGKQCQAHGVVLSG